MLKRPVSNLIQFHKWLSVNNKFSNFLHKDYIHRMNTQKQKVKARQNPFSNTMTCKGGKNVSLIQLL